MINHLVDPLEFKTTKCCTFEASHIEFLQDNTRKISIPEILVGQNFY